MAAISLAGVSKTFADGTVAVADLNLDVGDGELLAVLGPSGCGKSTALRIVAGLEAPSEGEVTIGGTVVTDAAPGARDLSIVFQDYALYPHMSVFENLAHAYPLRSAGCRGGSRAKRLPPPTACASSTAPQKRSHSGISPRQGYVGDAVSHPGPPSAYWIIAGRVKVPGSQGRAERSG